MGRTTRFSTTAAGTAVAVVMVIVAVMVTTLAPAGAQETGGQLERGVVYETADDADHEISLYELAVTDGGGANVVLDITANCSSLDASATLVTTADASGALDVTTTVSGEQPEDTFISGTVTLRGQVQPDGTISGTLDVKESVDDDDARFKPCTLKDDPWTAVPRPEPSLERIESYVPAPPPLRRFGAGTLASGDGALFTTRETDAETRLYRIDPATGDVVWSTVVKGSGPFTGVTFGQDLVWVSSIKGSDGDAIRSYDASTGKPVTTVQGSAIAFAPDGTGWTVREKGETLRRIDTESHEVSDEYEMDATLSPVVTASDDAVYVERRADDYKTTFEVVLARVDAATGEVTAEGEPQIGDFGATADADVVWLGTDDVIARLDATTLEPVATGEEDDQNAYDTRGALAVAPGLWFDDGSVQIFDAAIRQTTVPGLYGPLASDGSTVWVLVPRIGLVGLHTG